MIAFGLAPINGEIAKGTVRHMIDDLFFVSGYTVKALVENAVTGTMIAETTTWVIRLITGDFQRSREKVAVAHG